MVDDGFEADALVGVDDVMGADDFAGLTVCVVIGAGTDGFAELTAGDVIEVGADGFAGLTACDVIGVGADGFDKLIVDDDIGVGADDFGELTAGDVIGVGTDGFAGLTVDDVNGAVTVEFDELILELVVAIEVYAGDFDGTLGDIIIVDVEFEVFNGVLTDIGVVLDGLLFIALFEFIVVMLVSEVTTALLPLPLP